ncbi:hypothetical protein BKA61DRAFT_610662 [Leptodontidium sp. MPI-SDFR-AT-0119]|nr:hypothetical protein BKA61DRAFT_610662 [Leptodontidium sp. MPI-SDFR-AT-0119]
MVHHPSRRGLSSSSTTILRRPDLRLPTEEPAEPRLIYEADASRPNVPPLDERIWQQFKPPSKKRTVYVWQCCQCGLSSIGIQTDPCPECGTARCAYCQTTKISVR